MVDTGGHYCFIKNVTSGHVLDVYHKSSHPGTKVIAYSPKKHRNDNQMWYVDPPTRTIRNKMTDFCLDIEDGHVVVNPYNFSRPEQQFFIQDSHICRVQQPNMVVTVASQEKGAPVVVAPRSPGDVDRFEFLIMPKEGVPPVGATTANPPMPEGLRQGIGEPKLFYIVSTMNNKVMDVEKANPKPGADVNMYERKATPAPNQLWWKDEQGLLRSKLNDMIIDTSSGEAKLQPKKDGDPHQQWTLEGQVIINRAKPETCLDIKKAKDKNGAEIIPYKYHGGLNEHWFLNFI